MQLLICFYAFASCCRDCNGHSNQQFKGGGTYQWESVAQPGKCIDLYGGDTTNGKLLEIWDCAS